MQFRRSITCSIHEVVRVRVFAIESHHSRIFSKLLSLYCKTNIVRVFKGCVDISRGKRSFGCVNVYGPRSYYRLVWILYSARYNDPLFDRPRGVWHFINLSGKKVNMSSSVYTITAILYVTIFVRLWHINHSLVIQQRCILKMAEAWDTRGNRSPTKWPQFRCVIP